jgi:hypothetical protein
LIFSIADFFLRLVTSANVEYFLKTEIQTQTPRLFWWGYRESFSSLSFISVSISGCMATVRQKYNSIKINLFCFSPNILHLELLIPGIMAFYMNFYMFDY